MRSRNQIRDGSGNGPQSDLLKQINERLDELQFFDTATITVEQTTRGTRFHVKRANNAGGPATAPTAAAAGNDRGIYQAGATYAVNDKVCIQTGAAAGYYLSTIDNNTNDPATGIGWQQQAGGAGVGAWT